MKNYQERIPVIAIVLLGLAVVGLGAGIICQRVAASRLSYEIRDRTQQLADMRQELKECTSCRKDYTELSLKLGGRLPECTWSEQMPSMVSQLTGIVQPHGIRIETLRPEPMTTRAGVSRFPLGIEMQTGLAELTEVLKDIQSTVPLLSVERLDVRPAQGTPDRLQVSMRIASFVVIDKRAPLSERRALPNIEILPEGEAEITEVSTPEPGSGAKPNPRTERESSGSRRREGGPR